VLAGKEHLSIVASGVLDQGEVQPFAAVRASALAGEGALLDAEHHNALKVRSFSASNSSEDAPFLMPPPLISPPGTDWPSLGVREVDERL
jgi:hypothetical protein